QQLLGMGVSKIVNTIVIFVAAVVLMAVIDWQLTVLSVSLLVVLTLGFTLLGPVIQRRFLRVQEQFAALSSRAQENLSGIRVVKAYVQEDAQADTFRAANEEYVQANMAWARINSALWPLFAAVAGLAGLVLLYVGGQHVAAGRLSLGQFVQFNYYLILLSWPLIALGWVTNMFQQGAASLNRIEAILHRQPAIASPPHPIRPTAGRAGRPGRGRRPRGRARPAERRPGAVSRWAADGDRRARCHPVGRSEAADRHRAGGDQGPGGAGHRRCAVER